jgi:hypothetical protein
MLSLLILSWLWKGSTATISFVSVMSSMLLLQSDGAVVLEKLISNKYSNSFSGRTIDEVQSAIMASINLDQCLFESTKRLRTLM